MHPNVRHIRRAAWLAALVAAALAVLAPAAFAHGGPHAPGDAAHPMNQPALGLLVQGLGSTAGSPTPPLGQVFTRLPIANSSSKVQCHGDGTSGKRVQLLYVRADTAPDGYAASVDTITDWAIGADRIFRESAAATSGARHLRFVHDSACNLTIDNVVVSAWATVGIPGAPLTLLKAAVDAQGYNSPDRKYLMFVDAAVTCGVGTLIPDDTAGSGNRSNNETGYARVDLDKTGCFPGDYNAAHELVHNLGGVQASAPNSTPAGHCTDEWDLMCYDDDGTSDGIVNGVPLTSTCPGAGGSGSDLLFDCDGGDYFDTNPPAGSYLDTNWNTADSDFLSSSLGDVWAFVRANEPTTASYTPAADFNQNSTNAKNTITRASTGTYAVAFTNLASFSAPFGVVLVTAYGTAGEFCNAAWWNSTSTPDMVATVDCFDAAGNRADAQFDASLIRPTSTSADYAYLWANSSSSAFYTPSTTHQFNSTGALNEITRNSTGDYEVRLPGLGGAGGTVKVTAFSSSANTCKVASWRSSAGDKFVDVLCFDLAGAPVDAQFTLAYAHGISILANGATNGYVRADDADVALATPYTPNLDDQFNSTGATNTVTRNAQGLYRVTMPGLGVPNVGGNRGTVHVTSHHTTSKRCEVTNWYGGVDPLGGPSPLFVDVSCHTAAGAAANSKFVLQYTQ